VKGLLLMSLVLAWIAIPARAARDPDGRRGLRRTLMALFVVVGLYLAYLTMVHPVVYVPHWP
jgi:hypothetical protein